MTLDEALANARAGSTDEYALAYLDAIEDAVEQDGTEGLGVQLNYLLNNLKSWRGEIARDSKAAIREWVEEQTRKSRDILSQLEERS